MLPFFSIQTTEDYTMKALLMSSALLIAAALVPGSAFAQQSDLVACRFFRTFDQATASVCMTCG
jgi:hypothetical protein